MFSKKALAGVGVALVLGATVTFAHHSFAATYFLDRTATVEGTVAQFLFRNPHSFVHIEVKDESGKVTRYAAEWAAGTQLTQQGVGREALKVGDFVRATGNPGRSAADNRMRLTSIERPSDGWKWSGTFQ